MARRSSRVGPWIGGGVEPHLIVSLLKGATAGVVFVLVLVVVASATPVLVGLCVGTMR